MVEMVVSSSCFFVESLGWDKLVAAKMWYPICELIAV